MRMHRDVQCCLGMYSAGIGVYSAVLRGVQCFTEVYCGLQLDNTLSVDT